MICTINIYNLNSIIIDISINITSININTDNINITNYEY
jgi:hypothetical protein